MFSGVKYHKLKNGYYYRAVDQKTHYLHRDVWEYYNGKIPNGYQVHHVISKDYNEIDGLACVSETEHKSHHMNERWENPKENEYICAECGKLFKSSRMYSVNDERVFCSGACNKRYVHFHEKEIRLCAQCGKPFSAHKYKPKDFCSRKCMLDSKMTKCPMCDKVFIPTTTGQKYCSTKCGDNYRYRQKHIDEWTKTCPHCGKPFIAVTTKQVYCCNICAQVERTKRYRAKKKLLQTK